MIQTQCNTLDYIVQQTGAKPRQLGDKVLLDPCPVCKVHRGHFYVYPKTNSYYSFSGCCSGGDLVSWLVEYEKLPLSEAIRRVHGESQESAADKIKRQETQRLAKLLTQKVESFFNESVDVYKAFKELEADMAAEGVEYTDPVYRYLRHAVRYHDALTGRFISGTFEDRVKIMKGHENSYFYKLRVGGSLG